MRFSRRPRKNRRKQTGTRAAIAAVRPDAFGLASKCARLKRSVVKDYFAGGKFAGIHDERSSIDFNASRDTGTPQA